MSPAYLCQPWIAERPEPLEHARVLDRVQLAEQVLSLGALGGGLALMDEWGRTRK